MSIVFAILFVLCLAFAIFLLTKNKRLEENIIRVQNEAQTTAAQTQASADQRIAQMQQDAQTSVAEAQKLMDQQFAEMQEETDRIRQHFEAEARKSHEAANTLLAKTIKDFEPLRKYEKFRDAEVEAQRQLSDALDAAKALRSEAMQILEQARTASVTERTEASNRAKDIHEQADARLNQAIRDAGRIIAEAEKRAEQIGGDAYAALKDKQMLEQAAQAMRNIIEGYGDRYLVPTHSLLDDLAAEYGYDAAGQSLASAREQSRRMVEQGEAAACDYAEASRRNTAIQFVIHAFNGSVDATLTRVRSDNFGTLERRIRDCFSIVNRDGSAFRNARIQPAYLDARLAELKWAVIVQELAQRDREEQRYLKEQERDRQKAEEERQKKLREAEKEKELIRVAMEEAEKRVAAASAEHKAATEKELQELRQKLDEATKKELTIAQQTNKGRIYIISNLGSFGIDVYKIGLTRRSADERVDELCSASVPFDFDIHAVIETDDAPALEYKLHHHFFGLRMNKINLRKEFFRITLNEIRQVIEKLEPGKDYLGTVVWTEKAKAQQYQDTLNIDRDSDAKEKWLARARLVAERRQRITSRTSGLISASSNGNGNGSAPHSQETTPTVKGSVLEK